MEEVVARGSVLYTTTMRIHPPEPGRDLAVISCDNLPLLSHLAIQVIGHLADQNYRLVFTREFMEPDLLKGVPPDFLTSVDRSKLALLLNEADGSARFSVKLPREREPVLMDGADYLVPVIGLDCLHKPLGPDVVFRFEKLAERFSLKAGDPITPQVAAGILMHREGVCRDHQEGTTIVPFINKVDTPDMDEDARALAFHILQNANFPVEHVLWGSVHQGRIDSISADS